MMARISSGTHYKNEEQERLLEVSALFLFIYDSFPGPLCSDYIRLPKMHPVAIYTLIFLILVKIFLSVPWCDLD